MNLNLDPNLKLNLKSANETECDVGAQVEDAACTSTCKPMKVPSSYRTASVLSELWQPRA